MAKAVHPPRPPPLPTKLPFEEQVDKLLDRLAEALEQAPTTKMAKQFEETLISVSSVKFPTPLGTVNTPHLEFPSLTPPKLDERRKEVVKAALGQDLAILVALIPLAGDILADVMGDIYFDKLHSLLDPDEFATFKRLDAYNPSTIAALRTFIKHR